MKDRKGLGRRSLGGGGFTLIEMLVVITIILILASLLVVLIKGIVDRSRNTKTHGLVRLLDQGCHSYKVDYNVFPPYGSYTDSRCLHMALGSKRRLVKQHIDTTTNPGAIPIYGSDKPPIIEFHADMLQLMGSATNTDPNPPVPIIDAWNNVIKYVVPGVQNRKAVDIWSPGKDGIDDPPLATNTDDIANWIKDY